MTLWHNIKVLSDPDNDSVQKFVFEKDNAVAESVLYKYQSFENRTVICCSTQSGCPVGCRFCGAGDYFVRSLSTEEIVSQPVHLLEQTGVNPLEIKRLQIMFMSMGEPMLNLKNLLPALRELYAKYPNAALLISTSAPRDVDWESLIEISKEIPTIGLQFSVHESTDEKRNLLIPFKNKLTLEEISNMGTRWHEATGRPPYFNFCVTEKNGTKQDADNLYHLFNPGIWQATISVVCERNEHVAAAHIRQRELTDTFQSYMVEHGFSTRVFDPAGQDTIGGGCGQLWFVQQWMKEHPEKARPSIGFGKPIVNSPK